MRLSVRLVSAAVVWLASASSTRALLALLAVIVVVLLTVVGPAVWSRKRQRRADALAVLERLVRYRR